MKGIQRINLWRIMGRCGVKPRRGGSGVWARRIFCRDVRSARLYKNAAPIAA